MKNKDDPKRSEMVGMHESTRLLDCTHQHVRNLAKKYKRVRQYPFGRQTILYNRADIMIERAKEVVHRQENGMPPLPPISSITVYT